jgi:hypothetical protein
MLKTTTLMMGSLNGTIYDFEDVGDELPLHVHTNLDVHISIVGRGKFLIFGHGWEQESASGAVLDWEPGNYHGFRALEPNSRLINIVKGGTNGA